MTKHLKTIEQTYQVLSEIEHVRKRVGMYAGSPVLEEKEEFVYDSGKMIMKKISVVPALIKIVSEVLDNSVDEHKRNPTKLTQIKVNIGSDDNPNEISIWDNGGIPVVLHNELNKYVPEIIFGQLRSGSNYDDSEQQSVIGTNGIGSKLTNILSDYFIVETADGTHSFRQEFGNGMNERSDPIIRPSAKNYTRIIFSPDLTVYNNTISEITVDHRLKIIKRLVDIAGCNPLLKIWINNQKVDVKSFKDYIQLYTEEFVHESYDNWEIGVSSSSGFQQTSFVNAVETYMGGTHVDYVGNQIINALRDFFKKKHKIDVKPSDIKSHIHLFISCNINRPKFSSQTKENMISSVSEYGTSVQVSDKFIKRIIASPIIQSVLDWVTAKAKAAELAELRKKNKEGDKVNLKRIPKFHDATEKDRSKTLLFLAEGDAAASSVMAGRTAQYHACFPLKGRPINVSAAPFSKVKENTEFDTIRTIIGLRYGEDLDKDNINFGKIVIASDADSFGHSIAGLLINMFYRVWPDLVKKGYLYRLITPVVIAEFGGQILEFFTEEEFEDWRKNNIDKKYTYSFLKGLGSSDPAQFKKYMDNIDQYMVQLDFDEKSEELLDLCFLKDVGSADARKDWLDLE